MINCNDCSVYPDYLYDPYIRKDRLCSMCWRYMFVERNNDLREYLDKEISIWSKRAELWEGDGSNDAQDAKIRVSTLLEVKGNLLSDDI